MIVDKVLIISEYEYDNGTLTRQNILESNLLIVLAEDHFTILKNRWGSPIRDRDIPLGLLPKVLKNPGGKLLVEIDWK
jgi:hypothetical protein